MKERNKELENQCYVNGAYLDAEKFADLIRADEREACAKVCDDHCGWTPRMIGETIRARMKK